MLKILVSVLVLLLAGVVGAYLAAFVALEMKRANEHDLPWNPQLPMAPGVIFLIIPAAICYFNV